MTETSSIVSKKWVCRALVRSRVGILNTNLQAIISLGTLSHMICLPADEVERRFGLLGIPNRFSEAEKEELKTTPIVEAGERVLAFPVPQARSGLNILMLRKILGTNPSKQPSFFDHPWYLTESFGREDCTPGRHFLWMDVLPDSLSQPIDYASSFHARDLELPSATEVVLMLFLHYAGCGEQLLQRKHTWCRDRTSDGRFVTVGAFGRNGVFVSAHPGTYSSRGLGMCPKLSRYE